MTIEDNGIPKPEAAARAAYHAFMTRVYREEFGITGPRIASTVADDWFYSDDRHDSHFSIVKERLGDSPRILDLASGFGSALLRGLQLGINGFGLEPDPGKLALMRERIEAGAAEHGWPRAWRGRFVRGVGETLPFRNDSFDAVLSYQTLEHVRDPAAVLAEMLRVVRPGGGLHLGFPDYTGTFEGHYRLPWLPLLPRPLARLWLRACGRPLEGFEGIRYVTKRSILRRLAEAGRRTGTRLEIFDLERERYQERLREGHVPGWRGPALFWRVFYRFKRLFRVEIQVNLWVSVVEKRDPPAQR